jgi:hypothetical protein
MANDQARDVVVALKLCLSGADRSFAVLAGELGTHPKAYFDYLLGANLQKNCAQPNSGCLGDEGARLVSKQSCNSWAEKTGYHCEATHVFALIRTHYVLALAIRRHAANGTQHLST